MAGAKLRLGVGGGLARSMSGSVQGSCVTSHSSDALFQSWVRLESCDENTPQYDNSRYRS